PRYKYQLTIIKSVQRRFTKFILSVRHFPYTTRLCLVGLQTLEHRRPISDLCFVYKILNNVISIDLNDLPCPTNQLVDILTDYVNLTLTATHLDTFLVAELFKYGSVGYGFASSPTYLIFKNKITLVDLTQFLTIV
ncbi:hypothetical protein HELRODRAFT_79156, partial [Helobdella robusta]|uniref:Uncharacterized protein n=1 Tax=Helobdella robusta TaxID=6412 RepID=T1G3K9_HELRO